MIKVQLGPQDGTSAWKRGSILAWVLMREYGMEVPATWELPAIEMLPATKEWPERAVWR